MKRRFGVSRQALWATHNWCKASESLERWVVEHPYESLSHPEAQRLLQVKVGAIMLNIAAHPHFDKNYWDFELKKQMELME